MKKKDENSKRKKKQSSHLTLAIIDAGSNAALVISETDSCSW